MCGIAGFISKDRDRPADQRAAMLDRMCGSIRHRGPDDQGTLIEGRAALGMRRLAIIDVNAGQQPIFSEDGQLAVVFNGEIYNFRALREELEGYGHSFKTNSDTETIVHAYEQFGPRCVERLRGMFAFAIWDCRNEILFLARDRVGKKPLFYAFAGNGDLVFGSEIKAILGHGGVSREIDHAALDAYLTLGYVPEESCILSGVKKLPPGHYFTFNGRTPDIRKYWDIDLSSPEDRSEEDWCEAIREKLDESVRIRLESEVPLGAFLSGGVDSSSVVGAMSRALTHPVKTFSIGFEEDSFNELKYARVAAEAFGTEHHEFIVTPDVFDTVEDIVWHFDEPFADQSALPTYILSRLAREHVTVVLSGDGGDELFAGYERYVVHQRRERFSRMPHALRSAVLGGASALMPHAAPGKNFFHNISLGSLERYLDDVSNFNGPGRRKLYSAEFADSLNGSGSTAQRLFEGLRIDRLDATAQLMYVDSRTYLPADILTKVDRMTMASSIEARSPLLDHEFIELVARIPSSLKLKRGQTKYIFKKSLEGLVPDEILHRPKQGFGVPVNEWINSKLRGRIVSDLSDARTKARGYFDHSYLETLLKEHSRGRRDHSNRIWVLWMLELWFRRYIDAATI
jgi:asparagine synthase (glutamine-hydrolysing)